MSNIISNSNNNNDCCKNKKKKKLKREIPTTPPEGWKRCYAFIEKKWRFCRQEVIPGTLYCGNHNTSSNDDNNNNSNNRKRIQCPIDPTHTIYEDMKEKHIQKCPKARAIQKQKEQKYYKYNCNVNYNINNNKISNYYSNGVKQQNIKQKKDLQWAQNIAVAIMKSYNEIFCNDSNNSNIITNNNHNNDTIPLYDLSEQELVGLNAAITNYRIKSGGPKHIHQQASIIGHLRQMGIFCNNDDNELTNNTIILELGAGRGMTGLVVAGVAAATAEVNRKMKQQEQEQKISCQQQKSSNIHLIMIERSRSRSCAEKFLRKVNSFPKEFCSSECYNYMNLHQVQWKRHQCDLAHIYMPAIINENYYYTDKDNNKVNNNKLIVIAKHLCGAGTDLALKSLESISDKVTAVVMSTCCHGVCDWDMYVGREYLIQALGLPDFGKDEFDLLRLWSSGTVRQLSLVDNISSSNDNAKVTNNDNNLDDQEKEEQDEHQNRIDSNMDDNNNTTQITWNVSKIVESLNLDCGVHGFGRVCQRMIDYGRKEYMNHILFKNNSSNAKVQLCYYVPESVTPQNALLSAYYCNNNDCTGNNNIATSTK